MVFHFRELGKGAFGQVYQGYLKNYVSDSVEMPCAVKVSAPWTAAHLAGVSFNLSACGSRSVTAGRAQNHQSM